jgi:hypothetical protein
MVDALWLMVRRFHVVMFKTLFGIFGMVLA